MKSSALILTFFLFALLAAGVGLAQEGEKPAGEETPATPAPEGPKTAPEGGEATPGEGPVTPAEGEKGGEGGRPASGEKPAEGEAKPAEGEKPAAGEAKPGEGESKPSEASGEGGTPAPGEKKAPGEAAKAPSKKVRGFDLLKFKTGKEGKTKFHFTDGSIYQTDGKAELEIRREKVKGKFQTQISLKKGCVKGGCKKGQVCTHVGDLAVFGLNTEEEITALDNNEYRILNKGPGKLAVRGRGLLLELRPGQAVEVDGAIKAPATNKGDVGVIRNGKVELLKPGGSVKAEPSSKGKEPMPALCKKLASPDFLKDWFTVDTGGEGEVEFLLQDGGRIYSDKDNPARFEVFFMEASPRETKLNVGEGVFSFDLGPDLVTVELPKVLSIAGRNAVYRVSSVGALRRFEVLGGERVVATSAKELLKTLQIRVQADPKAAVDVAVDQATKNVVYHVTPETMQPVLFLVRPVSKNGKTGAEKKLLAPAGSRLSFGPKGVAVTVRIPKPQGEFAATIPLRMGVLAPSDAALQDTGDLVDIKNVSPGNP